MDIQTNTHNAIAGLTGRRVLGASGVGPATLAFRKGRIDTRTAPAADHLDAGDLLVLPGIVDLHGDAFERSVMPRPGVSFSHHCALLDVDRQLLANGITTEYHGLTLSWEGGLRGDANALRMFEALQALRPRLGANHLVHLRFEAYHLDGVDLALRWMADGRVALLAINDHLPMLARRVGNPQRMAQYAERAECSPEAFIERLRTAQAREAEVAPAVARLISAARKAGLPVASHDDPDSSTRQQYHRQGCTIAEFPLTPDVARLARHLGDDTVFGAPNVLRGGSHTGAPDATEMIATGLCTVLASDYYYPAPLHAALRIAQLGVLDLSSAWALVSRNPAHAAGLRDRGTLAHGLRADAILVDDSQPGLPRVCATIVGGALHFAAHAFRYVAPLVVA